MSQQLAIRGILKPMPEYGVHYRAGVKFTQHGREFVVDDAAVEKAFSDAVKVDEAKLDEEKRGPHKARLTLLKGGIIDEPDKPLVLSSKGYGYMKEGFGRQLVCEAWDGAPRPVETKKLTDGERLALLEKGFEEMKGMFQNVLERLKK